MNALEEVFLADLSWGDISKVSVRATSLQGNAASWSRASD